MTEHNSRLTFVFICLLFFTFWSFFHKRITRPCVSCTVHPVVEVLPTLGSGRATEVRLSLDPEDHHDVLAHEHKQQRAAHRKQQRGESRAGPRRSTLQRLLVGLVRRGRALWSRHGAGRQGGAAGAHVVEVPGKLRLPGLLSQRLPNSCCITGTASQSWVGTDVERVPGS